MPNHHSVSTNLTSHDVPAEGDLAVIMQKDNEKMLELLQSTVWDETGSRAV
jgi:hypothetical protein